MDQRRTSYKDQSASDDLTRRRNTLLIGGFILCILICAAVIGTFSWRSHVAREAVFEQAMLQVEQYDYDGAIATIKAFGGFERSPRLTSAIATCEEAKTRLVEVSPYEVTHIFFHSLINFPEWTFGIDNGFAVDDYNQSYTTVGEFNKIMQSIYDKGFVLVSIHDLYDVVENADGSTSVVGTSLLLPEGKKPLVLSLDDICYYEYMLDGDGFPTRVIIDEEGKPTCEMTMQDGSVQTGDFDTMPLLERFIEKHPDFSYRGARGIIALTGYDGILGYRTDPEYAADVAHLAANPGFDLEAERRKAAEAAEAMKACGWEFASHSWGHLYYGNVSYEALVTDMAKWKERVEPLIGPTDVMIYAFGNDITSGSYEGNAKFEYLKSEGFNAYCTVSARSPYSVTIEDRYIKQGRRNIDGYRMYQDIINPGLDRCSDLFDAAEVFDPARPLPVPDF